MILRSDTRDPLVAGGLALLALLSVLAVLLYGSAPASIDEVRTRAMSSARPGAFSPQLARAAERLDAARAAVEAGRDTAALRIYDEAREAAGAAWEIAGDDGRAGEAVEVWAAATLESAELMLEMGTASGLRPDDNEVLQRALERSAEVSSAPVDSAVQERADELSSRIERQLRPGPLEWLPPWRR